MTDPIAILAVALVWSWYHTDARQAARQDRQAERGINTELAKYNQQLQRLNQNDL